MRQRLESAVRRHAPPMVRRAIRRAKRNGFRARYRVRRLAASSLDRSDLVAALGAAGLREGDGIFVHSTMSRFGHIEGGPRTVVEAFEEVLGPNTLIAMPAFPLTGGSAEHLSANPIFDVRTTPSRMGAVTEYFRRLPDVERSLHPTHSVCARGPRARELVEGHAGASTPFGAGTPFARMIDLGLHQVWFGTGIETFTLYHSFECLRDGGFPLDVFVAQPMAARVVDEYGKQRTVRTLVHDPDVAGRKLRSRHEMRRGLEEAGVLGAARVGTGEILCARMPELMDALERLLERGITIYDPRLLGRSAELGA